MPQDADKWRSAIAIALCVFACTCHSGAARASENCGTGVRPQDEIFFVSTRGLNRCCCDANMSALEWREFAPCGDRCQRTWRTVPMDAFLASDDPSVPTLIFIHGNHVAPGQDVDESLAAYRAFTCGARTETPIRFLIFSWPSEKTERPLRDIRQKAGVADRTAYDLAWVIDRMAPDVPVGVAGFSYGARVATGALHHLGGGMLCGRVLDERIHPQRLPLRAVLIAAALDADWLEPGKRHERALSQIEHMFLINNRCDAAIKRYHWTDPCGRPTALGRFGLTGSAALGISCEKIEQFDACCAVGRRHSLSNYLSAHALIERAWRSLAMEAPCACAKPGD